MSIPLSLLPKRPAYWQKDAKYPHITAGSHSDHPSSFLVWQRRPSLRIGPLVWVYHRIDFQLCAGCLVYFGEASRKQYPELAKGFLLPPGNGDDLRRGDGIHGTGREIHMELPDLADYCNSHNLLEPHLLLKLPKI